MTSHNALRQDRIDLAAAYSLAVMHDLHEGVCNHLTYVPEGHDDRMLLIAHGLHWSEVTASNLLLVDFERNILEGDGVAETSAFYIHAPVHQARPEARCVLHTHMPYASALTMLEDGRLEPAFQTSLRFLDSIAYDWEYNGLALDRAEGERLANVMGDKQILFMGHHGIMLVASNAAQAYDALYYLERACMTQVLAMSTGLPLKHVSPDVVKATQRQYGMEVAQAEVHFAALKRVLDRDQPDYAN